MSRQQKFDVVPTPIEHAEFKCDRCGFVLYVAAQNAPVVPIGWRAIVDDDGRKDLCRNCRVDTRQVINSCFDEREP